MDFKLTLYVLQLHSKSIEESILPYYAQESTRRKFQSKDSSFFKQDVTRFESYVNYMYYICTRISWHSDLRPTPVSVGTRTTPNPETAEEKEIT